MTGTPKPPTTHTLDAVAKAAQPFRIDPEARHDIDDSMDPTVDHLADDPIYTLPLATMSEHRHSG